MRIAVVVPCRNEVKFIEECVRAIFNQQLPDKTELSATIVDGKSDDGTLEVLESLKKEFPQLEVVENTKQLTPYAFNIGIQANPDADYYQIVGARQILSPNYISGSLEKFLGDPAIWCVGGRVENVYLNREGEIIAQAMSTAFGMGLGNFRTLQLSGYTDTVGTPMYPAKVFEEIGLFDENLIRNQDDDFNFRVIKAGGRIYYNHENSIKYYVRGNYDGLRRQFYQYGYWKVFVNQKHKAVTTLRQLIPPAFVLYVFSIPLMALFGIATLWSLPLMVYIGLNIYFSLTTRLKGKYWLGMMITYCILHFSYGFGYIHGILDFIVFRKKPDENQKRLSR